MTEVPNFTEKSEETEPKEKSEKSEENGKTQRSKEKESEPNEKVEVEKERPESESNEKKSDPEKMDEEKKVPEEKVSDEKKSPEKVVAEQKTVENGCKTVDLFNPELYSNMGYNTKEGVQLLERPVLESLAMQRIDQILNPNNECYEPVSRNLRARAALFPIGHRAGPPAFMNYKTFTIGIGSNCDLPLSRYGHCDLISSKHAVIFYDEVKIKNQTIEKQFRFAC